MKPELLESLMGNIQKSHKYARTQYLRAEAGEMGIELAWLVRVSHQEGFRSLSLGDWQAIADKAQAIIDKLEGK